MISPQVHVTNLDPDGFAWLCDLAAARQARDARWLWVRHDGTRVLATVNAENAGPAVAALRLDDPDAATTLLHQADVKRVVLLDDRHRPALGEALDAAAAPDLTQWSYFRACQRAFWESPAVLTAPEPPADAWAPIAGCLARHGDLDLALLVYDGPALLLGLRASVREGAVVELTGAGQGPGAAPTVSPEELVQLMDRDRERELDAVLVATRGQIEACFEADNLPAAVLDLAGEGALFARGAELFTPASVGA